MPSTMKLVEAGLPGPAMLKNSSIQVSNKKAATESKKPYWATRSGILRPRPMLLFLRFQNVWRWTHSPNPPKGHIAHHARPTTTIITKTNANHRYHVIAVAKLSPGTTVPRSPIPMTSQKMIWLGRIMRNWNLRSCRILATSGWRAMSRPGDGSVALKRSLGGASGRRVCIATAIGSMR